MKFGMGQAVPRTEDARLLTGGGRYTDDVHLPGQTWMVVVRSPYAHARLGAIETAAAAAAPGVLAVFTGADLEAEGIGHIQSRFPLKQKDGSPLVTVPRPALAVGRVRHVGDPVAVVIAESLEAGRDAADLVEIDYQDLPAVTDPVRALSAGAPQIWDEAPQNLSFDWEKGERDTVDAAFAAAAHVTTIELVNNRLAPTSMEPRGIVAFPEEGRSAAYVTSQGVFGLRDQLKDIFRLEQDDLHIMTGDVGGGFGMKLFMYPEYVCAVFASRRLNRPVRWIGDRSESFLADDAGRDNVTKIALALDQNARFTAIRVETVANLGAYISNFGAFIPTEAGTNMVPAVYTTPAVHITVKGVFTNTAPVDAYRGAGRPEAAYMVERVVDAAARELGLSPAEIRRRNFVPAAAMPYTTPTGLTYDSGDFQRNMEDALKDADWDGFAARRQEALARGRLRGIGLASYIEVCAGGGPESARLEVDARGHITLYIGTQNNGQGHETAYKQILSDRLGVDADTITMVQGDSLRIATGGGTGGSRSVPVGGAAIGEAATALTEKARQVAADILEAAAADIELSDGRFRVVGTDRAVGFADVCARASEQNGGGTAFDETGKWKPPIGTFPNGTHVCELEIDLDTGVPEIVRYTVVDDFGKVVNPNLLAGQVHGGVVQGVGQALYEGTLYDDETGQLLTGSFMDYCLPRADDVPFFQFRWNEIPCTTNPLGIKGAGEAGAIGAPPAVINAVVDALAAYGVRHVDMPATPQKLWALIQAGRPALAAE